MQRKYHGFGKTVILILQFFVVAKQLTVIKTMVFLKTVVFLEYIENTLLSNGA